MSGGGCWEGAVSVDAQRRLAGLAVGGCVGSAIVAGRALPPSPSPWIGKPFICLGPTLIWRAFPSLFPVGRPCLVCAHAPIPLLAGFTWRWSPWRQCACGCCGCARGCTSGTPSSGHSEPWPMKNEGGMRAGGGRGQRTDGADCVRLGWPTMVVLPGPRSCTCSATSNLHAIPGSPLAPPMSHAPLACARAHAWARATLCSVVAPTWATTCSWCTRIASCVCF
jgi:hypothetical protein